MYFASCFTFWKVNPSASGGLEFVTALVAHGELVAAFATTGTEYALTVGGLHALTKPMGVLPFPAMRLKCPLHFLLINLSFPDGGDAKLRKVSAGATDGAIILENLAKNLSTLPNESAPGEPFACFWL
jgi:hypothetical protein